jgi:hypothetical protein
VRVHDDLRYAGRPLDPEAAGLPVVAPDESATATRSTEIASTTSRVCDAASIEPGCECR